MRVRVEAPATTANLGAGFDVFGMALGQPRDVLILEEARETVIEIRRADLPTNPRENTAGVVANVLDAPARIIIEKGVPPGSGLGSSAASAAGAAVGLNELYNLGLDKEELVWVAAEGERAAAGAAHPDNVAPCILGGFTIAHSGHVIQFDPPEVGVVAVLPDIRVSTRRARAILPPQISMDDLVDSVGWASLMIAGVVRGDVELMGRSLQDHVVDRARARLITGFEDVRRMATEMGAYGVTVSGSGPTVVALCPMDEREGIAGAMQEAFGQNKVASTAYITQPGQGASVRIIE